MSRPVEKRFRFRNEEEIVKRKKRKKEKNQIPLHVVVVSPFNCLWRPVINSFTLIPYHGHITLFYADGQRVKERGIPGPLLYKTKDPPGNKCLQRRCNKSSAAAPHFQQLRSSFRSFVAFFFSFWGGYRLHIRQLAGLEMNMT